MENCGVGCELKKALEWFEPAGGCSACNQKARMMDVNGPDWCEKNIDTVVNWLLESARKRTIMLAIPGVSTVTAMVARKFITDAIEKVRNAT